MFGSSVDVSTEWSQICWSFFSFIRSLIRLCALALWPCVVIFWPAIVLVRRARDQTIYLLITYTHFQSKNLSVYNASSCKHFSFFKYIIYIHTRKRRSKKQKRRHIQSTNNTLILLCMSFYTFTNRSMRRERATYKQAMSWLTVCANGCLKVRSNETKQKNMFKILGMKNSVTVSVECVCSLLLYP